MAFSQKLFTSLHNYTDPDTRIGELNRIWYDSVGNVFRIQLDKVTPGGTIIGGSGGSGGYTLPTASTTTLGGVKVDGNTITINNGIIQANYTQYTLPTASQTTLGGVKVDGTTITINGSGVISSVGTGTVVFKGTWNASTNSPQLSATMAGTELAQSGWEYLVSATGTRDIGSGVQTYYAGDLVIYDGVKWNDIPGNAGSVVSFNTRTGAITLTSTDVTTALGYTPIQLSSLSVQTASASGGGALAYNNTNGVFTFTPGSVTGITSVDNTVQISINGSGVNDLSIATSLSTIDKVFAYVTNDDSVTIHKGDPVYLYRATGNRPSVIQAKNTSDAYSAKTLGLASQDIAPGTPGWVQTQGVLTGVDTSAFAEGDTLYLSATAGVLTNVKPYAPNHLVYIGVVVRANQGQGQIYIRPQNGYELDEIHDVDVGHTRAKATGQTIVWNGTRSVWENNSYSYNDLTNTPTIPTTVTVNGTSITLNSSGTVTAAADTLTGTTLNSTVVSSSLTSVGTLGSLTVQGGTGTYYAARFKGNNTGDQFAIGLSSTAGYGAGNDVLNAAGTAYAPYTISASTMTFKTGSSVPATAFSIDSSGNVTFNNTVSGSISGNAATATKLAATKNINGVAFDGSADITITAAAGTLTGTTLNSSVVTSSLTSVGTLNGLTVSKSTTGTALSITASNLPAYGGTATWQFVGNGNISGPGSWIQFPDSSVQTTAYTGNAATVTNGVYTTDTGTVTNTMLAGSIANAKLLNSSITVNGTSISLGSSATVTAAAGTLTGVTLNSTVVNSSLTSVGTLTNLTSAGTVIFTDTTNSLNTTTGALQVRGGVGVAGNIYLGGGINATGSIYSAGVNVTYAPVNPTGQAFQATGKDTQGGTGYFDFFKVTNTTSGGTNGSKTMRLNSVGTLEILNNAYNATILSITDAGFISINASSSATDGVPVNNGIAMNANSYIFDDGNYHITAKTGNIWLNSNNGGTVNINTQMPSGVTGGGMVVQGAVKSYGSGGSTAFISSGANVISGVALQMDSGTAGTAANMAVRDTSTVSSTMYFDVSTGGSGHGTFQFRSSNAFTQLMSLSNSQVAINKQTLFGGGSFGAYVTITGTNSYNLGGPYGYLSGGGAGSVGSGGNTGTVGWSLQCAGRIQVNEVDATSDERLKDIQGTIPLDRALQFVRAVDGILYTWKPGFGDEGLKSGFGAQSVHKAGFDHMVAPIPNERVEGSTDADGFTSPDKFQLTLNYMEAIPYHHEVIKHLLDRIEQLEATVAKLAK